MLPLDWSVVDHRRPPGIDEIHLWALDLSNINFDAEAKKVPEAERIRSQRILDQEKRMLYLGGRMGLRILLSRYTGIDHHNLQFGYGTRGKPVLLNEIPGGEITFNYTLSRDKVLYGVSRNRQVGVDMEVLPRRVNAEAMAARKLTIREQRAWQGLPAALRNDSMLCCWTRKEAYGKAIGVGIRYQLNAVNLFDQLDNCRWRTDLAGLFMDNLTESMPCYLEGVQLQLPFYAMASLTYETLGRDSPSPSLSSAKLEIG